MYDPEQMLTEQQVQAVINLSLSKLRKDRHMKIGIPYAKFHSSVRYKYSDVKQYIRENTYESRDAE